MVRSLFLFCSLFILHSGLCFTAEENFLLIDGMTHEIVAELGPHIDERVTPASTFKIALSLIGYDIGILLDEENPVWYFQEGYDDYLESWKEPQSPKSWMRYSCIWYSRVLAMQLEKENIERYLAAFDYGNHDLSGGVTEAWVNSSLQISPKEQVDFIQKMIHGTLPVSSYAIQMTKEILFKEELPGGWKLYGKTGWGGSIKERDSKELESAWFIGWIENDHITFPFAYNIRDQKINLSQRIPRVKQLLKEANIL